MGEINSYRDLKVWRDGMTLVEDCYRFSEKLPKGELFGLTSQLRRAALSTPANFAEGYGRDGTGSWVNLFRNPQGSGVVEGIGDPLTLAQRLKFGNFDLAARLLARSDAVGRMLRSLIRNLEPAAES